MSVTREAFHPDAAWLLGPEGPFSGLHPNFAPRLLQQEMAAAVEQALGERAVLVCEAGTGTGKTFAYLVPAVASGTKVIVSTGTRSLQDQLYFRDLPRVKEALGAGTSTALLKGRANYLCHHRLELYHGEHRHTRTALAEDLGRLMAWRGRTASGDVAEVPDVPENAEVWRYATSTVDNCLGQECPHLEDCFVARARRAAMDADLVVINHHLFFADLALRDEGFGELLPTAGAFVMDEAHQIPAVASRFFSTTVSSRQLAELARDAAAAYHREAGDMPEVTRILGRFEGALRSLREGLGMPEGRHVLDERLAEGGAAAAYRRARAGLDELAAGLEVLAPRGKDLAACHGRALELVRRLERIVAGRGEEEVAWLEAGERGFQLHLTPVSVADQFGRHVEEGEAAWVFTSATLAVDGRFGHFDERLGLAPRYHRRWDSPFDYRSQALCYVPAAMPDPADPAYVDAVVEKAVAVLAASRGRAFVLFTSHRSLQRAAPLLAERLTFPLMVQGERPRTALLERFRATPNGVLLGTGSFWEGVDVRGEALSCVIIDKLPFAPPDDPLLRARLALVRERGGNPFAEHQVPEAVITLKQGVGRLIRDVNDRGVLVICDPRVVARSYGRVFLRSLPAMPLTQRLEDVRGFFQAAEAGA